FGDDRDVRLFDTVADFPNALDGLAQHLDGIPPGVPGIAVREDFPHVPRSSRAKHGVSQRMADGITIRMPVEMQIERDLDAAENQRARMLEAVCVVTEYDGNHAACPGAPTGK